MTTDPARAACAGLPDIFESTTLFDHRIGAKGKLDKAVA